MANYRALMDGAGVRQLQDGTGNRLLQDSGAAAASPKRLLLLGVGSLMLAIAGWWLFMEV